MHKYSPVLRQNSFSSHRISQTSIQSESFATVPLLPMIPVSSSSVSLGSSSWRISLRVAVFRHPFLSYITEYRQSAQLFLQSSELGFPNPSPVGKCARCHPLVPGGGEHSLARDGVGESQFRRGEINCGTLYLYALCVLHLHPAINNSRIRIRLSVVMRIQIGPGVPKSFQITGKIQFSN